MSLLPSQDQHELVIQFVQVRECSGNPNTSSNPYASEFLPLLIDVLDGHHLIYQNKKDTISIIGRTSIYTLLRQRRLEIETLGSLNIPNSLPRFGLRCPRRILVLGSIGLCISL
jgi:hypothetical protein